MSKREGLVLLCDADVGSESAYRVESNCACATDSPVLLHDRSIVTSHVAESDCACAVEKRRDVVDTETCYGEAPHLMPPLHLAGLTDRFWLGFNPLGQGGVAVFNRGVHDLLQAFRQPLPIAEGVRAAGDPPGGHRIAARLASLSLLEPIGSTPRARFAQARTLTAWLHITNDCNLRCPYCYVDKTPDKMQIEQGRRAVEAVFRSALANGFRRVKLKYAGGEATLNFAMVCAVHEHAQTLAERHGLDLEGVVLSNGVASGLPMIRELKRLGIRMMISLDGVGESHDGQRPFADGRGSFKHVEGTLDRLAAEGVVPSISITITRRNLAGLADTVDYVLQRDLPFVLNFYRENDCSISFGDLAYDDEEIIAAIRSAFAVIEANLPPYSLTDRLLDLGRLDAPHERTCGVGQSYLVIDQRGAVAKCHMDLAHPVTDIDAADPLRLIRADQIGIQNPSVEEKEGCRDCTWRNWCAGGCPALTYRVTGRYDIKSPNCRIYKAIFPDVLRLEGLRLLKYGQTDGVGQVSPIH